MRTSSDILKLSLWTEAAAIIALSLVLGNFRLIQLPAGGSVSLAAAPLIMFAIARGGWRGTAVGAIAGVGHLLMGGTVVHPIQALLDYPVSYALLGLAGVFRAAPVVLAVAVGMAAQLGAMTASGVVFFASVTQVANPWTYSFIYNAATQVPEAIIVALVSPAFIACFKRVDQQFQLEVSALTPRMPVAQSAHENAQLSHAHVWVQPIATTPTPKTRSERPAAFALPSLVGAMAPRRD